MHWRTHLLWQRVLLRDLVFPQPEMEEEFRRSEGEFQANFISFWILLSTLFWSVYRPFPSKFYCERVFGVYAR